MRNPESIASLDRVSKSYAGKVAVADVTLHASRGELVLLSGHSGSGKSTALSMLEGIVRPDAGSVTVFGQAVHTASRRKINRLMRGRVGVGYQAPLLDRSFSVADNVRLTANANGIKIGDERVVELAAQFGMLDTLTRQAGGLSGGEQVRAALMRTLAPNPELVLLDEPTGALETAGKKSVFHALRGIVDLQQTTVVMVTHDPDVARSFADREYVLESGRVLAEL